MDERKPSISIQNFFNSLLCTTRKNSKQRTSSLGPMTLRYPRGISRMAFSERDLWKLLKFITSVSLEMCRKVTFCLFQLVSTSSRWQNFVVIWRLETEPSPMRLHDCWIFGRWKRWLKTSSARYKTGMFLLFWWKLCSKLLLSSWESIRQNEMNILSSWTKTKWWIFQSMQDRRRIGRNWDWDKWMNRKRFCPKRFWIPSNRDGRTCSLQQQVMKRI